ncbi:MAG: heme ABC transporter permease CcmB [Desulfovibrio sp.]|nr:heme ABC transporter permease CcmB [Desulfovibrio sp.]
MLRLSLAIARKDLVLTLARGNGLVQALLLGLLLLFVFSLAQGPGEKVGPQAAAAMFWLASAFSQVLIFNRLYDLEEANAARLGLALVPAPVQAVWLGKLAAGFALLLLAQAVFLPAALVFLGQDVAAQPLTGLAILALVDAGMCALGSLLGALAQGQSGRESLLGVVLFPLLTPLLLAGIGVGAQCLGAPAPDGPAAWLRLAAAFDSVFLGVGLVLFGFIYPGED